MKKERTGWLIAAICLTVISALLWLAAGNFWSGLTSRMEEGILLCLPGEVPEEMLAYAEEEGWQTRILEEEEGNFQVLLDTKSTGKIRFRETEKVTLLAFGQELEGDCLNLSLHKYFLEEFSLLALALALLPVFCWILVEVWKLLCRIRLRPVRYLPESALAVFLFCTALVLVLGAIHIPREFLPMENVFDMDFYAGSVREFLGQVQSLGEVVPQYRELEHLYQTGLKLFGIFVAGVWGGTLWLAVKRKR